MFLLIILMVQIYTPHAEKILNVSIYVFVEQKNYQIAGLLPFTRFQKVSTY